MFIYWRGYCNSLFAVYLFFSGSFSTWQDIVYINQGLTSKGFSCYLLYKLSCVYLTFANKGKHNPSWQKVANMFWNRSNVEAKNTKVHLVFFKKKSNYWCSLILFEMWWNNFNKVYSCMRNIWRLSRRMQKLFQSCSCCQQ